MKEADYNRHRENIAVNKGAAMIREGGSTRMVSDLAELDRIAGRSGSGGASETASTGNPNEPEDDLTGAPYADLLKVAKAEGVELDGRTAAEVLASIRAHRVAKAKAEDDGLGAKSLNEIRDIASGEGLDLGAEEDLAKAVASLRAHREGQGS